MTLLARSPLGSPVDGADEKADAQAIVDKAKETVEVCETCKEVHQRMDGWPRYPVVYGINTWAWLQELSEKYASPVTLARDGMMRAKIMIAAWGLLMVSGCAGIGAPTVSRDRSDYSTAISDSWKQQMLFNMVKLRYGDAPVFLDVSSVISQYQIGGQINLGATFNHHPWSSSQVLGAEIMWTVPPSPIPPSWEKNSHAA